MRAVYLHGFASSPRATKAVAIAGALRERGVTVDVPDLNRPSFGALTYRAMLDAVEALVPDGDRVVLVGSSLGGYIATRFAQLHPDRVERLVLLAPAFDLVARWRELLGDDAFALWEKKGAFFFPDAEDEPTPVHWGLVQDALRHPAVPAFSCSALILHGRDDAIVPLESSQALVGQPGVTLVELDDDHDLLASLDTVVARTVAFVTG